MTVAKRGAGYGSTWLDSRSAPKGAVSRDKGAMIRLVESTYARIRKSIEKVGLCTSIGIHMSVECNICLGDTTKMLKWARDKSTGAKWCLCEYHQREVGVLW